MSDDSTKHRVLSDLQFREMTLEGGATRQINTRQGVIAKQDVGYAVGGKKTPAGEQFPPDPVNPATALTEAHVREHLSKLQETFGEDPTAHQGSWLEDDGSAVLDAVDVYPEHRKARWESLMRGEQGYFDVNKGETILIKVAGKRSSDQHPIRDWTP